MNRLVSLPRSVLSVLHHRQALLHSCSPLGHFLSRTVWKKQKDSFATGKDVPEYADENNVFGCRRNIKTSPWKLNLVAKQIRNLPIDEAITQMSFSNKKAAESVRQVLVLTKRNALVNHNVSDPSNMYVAESYVGKGRYGRGLRRANRGRGYHSVKPRTNYYLRLRVGQPPKEEHSREKTGPEYFTKRLQTDLIKNLPRVPNSLHTKSNFRNNSK
eukprot:m.10153 g.10153  ORF g.10153 m.10153 type:complete len:215 (+) comp6530_c0_seq1:132-776(+)